MKLGLKLSRNWRCSTISSTGAAQQGSAGAGRERGSRVRKAGAGGFGRQRQCSHRCQGVAGGGGPLASLSCLAAGCSRFAEAVERRPSQFHATNSHRQQSRSCSCFRHPRSAATPTPQQPATTFLLPRICSPCRRVLESPCRWLWTEGCRQWLWPPPARPLHCLCLH